MLRQKLEEAKISVASQVGRVQIVDYARLPGRSGQNQNRTLLMGLIFGLGLGMVLAFIREFSANSEKEGKVKMTEYKSIVLKNITELIPDKSNNKANYCKY